MTKKQVKQREEYLNQQSEILNSSVDFWQAKTLEQVSWVEQFQENPTDFQSTEEFSFFQDEYEESDDPVYNQATRDLNHCMMKLQWENDQLVSLDKEIKVFLKEKAVWSKKTN